MDSKKMKMPGKCEGSRCTGMEFNFKLKRWERRILGGHDLVRRVDPYGEVLVWCRHCAGYGWCRLELKLMNRCRPEQQDTKGHRKMSTRILELEEGAVPDREAQGRNMDEEKRVGHKKE